MQKNKKASEYVVEYIQEKISSGEWKPGDKIYTETQLMESTGIGKASVREAVERLSAVGILIKRQGAGTFVKEQSIDSLLKHLSSGIVLNQETIIEILDFREIIEPNCMKLILAKNKEETIQKLEDCLNRMEQAVEHFGDHAQMFHLADAQYHLEIAKGTGNNMLIQSMEMMGELMARYHYTASQTIGAVTGVQEHRNVLEALKKGDAELAALLMKRHIQRSRKDMLAWK